MSNLPSPNPPKTLTEKLLSGTEITKIELIDLERKLNFPAVLKSDEPNFRTLVLTQEFSEVVKPVTAIAFMFLRGNFSDQSNIEDVAVEFAGDVIQREPTWTIDDVIYFFKFIRMNQGRQELRFYGKVTSLRLLEMVATYEGDKADEREKVMNEKKVEVNKNSIDILSALVESGKINPDKFKKDKLDNPVSISMGKLLEKAHLKNDDKKVVYETPADEKYFAKYIEPDIPIEYQDTPPKPYPFPPESFSPDVESPSSLQNIEEKS